MKRIWFLFLALLALPALAQTGKIKFDKTEHDFGKIYEDAGNANVKFSFVNEGNAPLLITNAQASCGCTTPEWTKEPIMPGKKGFVTVQYNPSKRPGPFTKSVTVTTNGDPESVGLTIRGEVIPAGAPKVAESREFLQYFPYNKKVITLGEEGFQDFIKSLLPNYEKFGNLNFSIESSSSHVPTKAYKTNEQLTKARATEARAKIIDALKKVGVDPAKVKFGEDKTLVQGPDYKGDAATKMAEYEKYQYIKVIAQ
jgi:hypothetical protein